MYLDEELDALLERARRKTGKSSQQEVVTDVLRHYTSVWQNVHEAARSAIEKQTQTVLREKETDSATAARQGEENIGRARRETDDSSGQ